MKVTLVQNREIMYKDEQGREITTMVPYAIEGHMRNTEDIAYLTNLLFTGFDNISVTIAKEEQ